jgi:hypothetical protein
MVETLPLHCGKNLTQQLFFVHEAFQGSWYEQELFPCLKTQGHKISTPILIGLGKQITRVICRLRAKHSQF